MRETAKVTNGEAAFFLQELRRWQPFGEEPAKKELSEAEAYCRSWARNQYENFTVVSWLLPRRVRQDFYNVYAYCRWADNLADEIEDHAESLQLLDEWEAELIKCWGGEPRHPILIALKSTVIKYDFEPKLFLDLLSAFRQDREVFRYENAVELVDYCRRSANPVGRILLHLAKCHEPEALARSDDVCTGLQLANFCQDMSRDAVIGRIYAPSELWGQHEVTEQMILQRQPTSQLQSMLSDWVAETREYFVRGRALIDMTPSWLSTDVKLFIGGGESILSAIEKQGFDVWTRRPTVSKAQKVWLLMRALLLRRQRS